LARQDRYPLSSGSCRWLCARAWRAGDVLTYADLAAAAHPSVAADLGDVPWSEDEAAKTR
jgi:glutathione S-transferase